MAKTMIGTIFTSNFKGPKAGMNKSKTKEIAANKAISNRMFNLCESIKKFSFYNCFINGEPLAEKSLAFPKDF